MSQYVVGPYLLGISRFGGLESTEKARATKRQEPAKKGEVERLQKEVEAAKSALSRIEARQSAQQQILEPAQTTLVVAPAAVVDERIAGLEAEIALRKLELEALRSSVVNGAANLLAPVNALLAIAETIADAVTTSVATSSGADYDAVKASIFMQRAAFALRDDVTATQERVDDFKLEDTPQISAFYAQMRARAGRIDSALEACGFVFQASGTSGYDGYSGVSGRAVIGAVNQMRTSLADFLGLVAVAAGSVSAWVLVSRNLEQIEGQLEAIKATYEFFGNPAGLAKAMAKIESELAVARHLQFEVQVAAQRALMAIQAEEDARQRTMRERAADVNRLLGLSETEASALLLALSAAEQFVVFPSSQTLLGTARQTLVQNCMAPTSQFRAQFSTASQSQRDVDGMRCSLTVRLWSRGADSLLSLVQQVASGDPTPSASAALEAAVARAAQYVAASAQCERAFDGWFEVMSPDLTDLDLPAISDVGGKATERERLAEESAKGVRDTYTSMAETLTYMDFSIQVFTAADAYLSSRATFETLAAKHRTAGLYADDLDPVTVALQSAQSLPPSGLDTYRRPVASFLGAVAELQAAVSAFFAEFPEAFDVPGAPEIFTRAQELNSKRTDLNLGVNTTLQLLVYQTA